MPVENPLTKIPTIKRFLGSLNGYVSTESSLNPGFGDRKTAFHRRYTFCDSPKSNNEEEDYEWERTNGLLKEEEEENDSNRIDIPEPIDERQKTILIVDCAHRVCNSADDRKYTINCIKKVIQDKQLKCDGYSFCVVPFFPILPLTYENNFSGAYIKECVDLFVYVLKRICPIFVLMVGGSCVELARNHFVLPSDFDPRKSYHVSDFMGSGPTTAMKYLHGTPLPHLNMKFFGEFEVDYKNFVQPRFSCVKVPPKPTKTKYSASKVMKMNVEDVLGVMKKINPDAKKKRNRTMASLVKSLNDDVTMDQSEEEEKGESPPPPPPTIGNWGEILSQTPKVTPHRWCSDSGKYVPVRIKSGGGGGVSQKDKLFEEFDKSTHDEDWVADSLVAIKTGLSRSPSIGFTKSLTLVSYSCESEEMKEILQFEEGSQGYVKECETKRWNKILDESIDPKHSDEERRLNALNKYKKERKKYLNEGLSFLRGYKTDPNVKNVSFQILDMEYQVGGGGDEESYYLLTGNCDKNLKHASVTVKLKDIGHSFYLHIDRNIQNIVERYSKTIKSLEEYGDEKSLALRNGPIYKTFFSWFRNELTSNKKFIERNYKGKAYNGPIGLNVIGALNASEFTLNCNKLSRYIEIKLPTFSDYKKWSKIVKSWYGVTFKGSRPTLSRDNLNALSSLTTQYGIFNGSWLELVPKDADVFYNGIPGDVLDVENQCLKEQPERLTRRLIEIHTSVDRVIFRDDKKEHCNRTIMTFDIETVTCGNVTVVEEGRNYRNPLDREHSSFPHEGGAAVTCICFSKFEDLKGSYNSSNGMPTKDGGINYKEYAFYLGKMPKGLEKLREKGLETFSFDSEENLLVEFLIMIKLMDPDVIMAHNGIEFDIRFILNRFTFLRLHEKYPPCMVNFGAMLNPKRFTHQIFNIISSKALANVKVIRMSRFGVYVADTMVIAKREFKVVSNALNHLSRVKLKDKGKNDLPYSAIPTAFWGDGLDVLVDYCRVDVELVLRLALKFCMLVGTLEKSAISCWVTMNEYYKKGQMSKVFGKLLDITTMVTEDGYMPKMDGMSLVIDKKYKDLDVNGHFNRAPFILLNTQEKLDTEDVIQDGQDCEQSSCAIALEEMEYARESEDEFRRMFIKEMIDNQKSSGVPVHLLFEPIGKEHPKYNKNEPKSAIDLANEMVDKIIEGFGKSRWDSLMSTFGGGKVFDIVKAVLGVIEGTVDFDSLYPSLIIALNYSFDTKIFRCDLHKYIGLLCESDFNVSPTKRIVKNNDKSVLLGKRRRVSKFNFESEKDGITVKYDKEAIKAHKKKIEETEKIDSDDTLFLKPMAMRLFWEEWKYSEVLRHKSMYFNGTSELVENEHYITISVLCEDNYKKYKELGIVSDEEANAEKLIPGSWKFVQERFCDKTLIVPPSGRIGMLLDSRSGLGVIPLTNVFFINSRSVTKKLMFTFDFGSVEYNLQNSKQMAEKTSGNSVYGFTGNENSGAGDKDIAAATTSSGVKSIIHASNIAEKRWHPDNPEVYLPWKRYFEEKKKDAERRGIPLIELFEWEDPNSFEKFFVDPVLDVPESMFHHNGGDTDSYFFVMSFITNIEEALEIGPRIAYICNVDFTKPINLSFEKAMLLAIRCGKKKYAALLFTNEYVKNMFAKKRWIELNTAESDWDSIFLGEYHESKGISEEKYLNMSDEKEKKKYRRVLGETDGNSSYHKILTWDNDGAYKTSSEWRPLLSKMIDHICKCSVEETIEILKKPRWSHKSFKWRKFGKIFTRGLEVVRRETVGIVKDIMNGFFELYFREGKRYASAKYVRDEILKLIKREGLLYSKLVKSAGYNKINYKTKPAHIKANEKNKLYGLEETQFGNRIEYFYTKRDQNEHVNGATGKGKLDDKVSDNAHTPLATLGQDMELNIDKYKEMIEKALGRIIRLTHPQCWRNIIYPQDDYMVMNISPIFKKGDIWHQSFNVKETKPCSICNEDKQSDVNVFDGTGKLICRNCVKLRKNRKLFKKRVEKHLKMTQKEEEDTLSECRACTGVNEIACNNFSCGRKPDQWFKMKSVMKKSKEKVMDIEELDSFFNNKFRI